MKQGLDGDEGASKPEAENGRFVRAVRFERLASS